MILTDLATRAIARFRDTAGVYTDAQWKAYVNDAYMDAVAARHDWPFLESRSTGLVVTSGAGTVSLPTDGWRVSSVYSDTDKYALAPLDGRNTYRLAYPDPTASLGRPEVYRLRNNVLEVYPFVDAATTLIVDLWLPPAALADADEPVFPEQYHRALVAGALRYAYEDQGNLQQAQLHAAAFSRFMSLMIQDLIGNRTEHYVEVRDIGV